MALQTSGSAENLSGEGACASRLAASAPASQSRPASPAALASTLAARALREEASKFTFVRVEKSPKQSRSPSASLAWPVSAMAPARRRRASIRASWAAAASGLLPHAPLAVQPLPLAVCSHWLQNISRSMREAGPLGALRWIKGGGRPCRARKVAGGIPARYDISQIFGIFPCPAEGAGRRRQDGRRLPCPAAGEALRPPNVLDGLPCRKRQKLAGIPNSGVTRC